MSRVDAIRTALNALLEAAVIDGYQITRSGDRGTRWNVWSQNASFHRVMSTREVEFFVSGARCALANAPKIT